MKFHARYDELCVVLLVLLCLYVVLYVQLALVVIDDNNPSRSVIIEQEPSRSVIIEPFGPMFKPILNDTSSNSISSSRTANNSISATTSSGKRRRVLVISAAPRTTKHIVSLWSSLECFTADVDHVVVSAPTWSRSIMEPFLVEAKASIPRFSSGQVSLEGMVTINDRYDVGLWCDALVQLGGGIESPSSSGEEDGFSSFDEIGLLNDSVFALREYTGILSALKDRNVSMTSLSYSLIHPKGTGPEHYWLESVWRGFDQEGIRTFVDYSCRPADDPLFCSNRWWGQKGCIVENFERAMARQFPRDQTLGLFESDVPKDMLTWKNSFPTWVRNPPYWNKLVTEQDFPVSKVNWEGMIDSVDDDRLKTCTKYLDRSWLEGFDFSLAKAAI